MNTKKELLKSFVIGSSLLAFITFFTGVTVFFQIEKSAIFDYHRYSILAPLGLGIASLFAKYLHLYQKVSLRSSYFYTSIISILFIWLLITNDWDNIYVYEKDSNRGKLQYILILMAHLIVYNMIIYPIDLYL
jgi:hypothetical protein